MDKFYVKLIVVFCLINGLGIAYTHVLARWGIADYVGLAGNTLLAVFTAISYRFNLKAVRVKSHHAFLRMVYVSTFGKLLACLAGILVYIFLYREHISKGSILLFLALYLIYSVLETISFLKASKSSTPEP